MKKLRTPLSTFQRTTHAHDLPLPVSTSKPARTEHWIWFEGPKDQLLCARDTAPVKIQ